MPLLFFIYFLFFIYCVISGINSIASAVILFHNGTSDQGCWFWTSLFLFCSYCATYGIHPTFAIAIRLFRNSPTWGNAAMFLWITLITALDFLAGWGIFCIIIRVFKCIWLAILCLWRSIMH